MKQILGLILSILALQANANLNQWLERQAYEFLKSELTIDSQDDRIEVSVRSLDARVKIPDCASAWEFDIKAKSRGSAVVSAQCGATKVHLSARYARQIDVVVAAAGLNRGDIVRAQDLKLKTVLENEIRGSWHTDTDALIGQAVKRNIQPGQPVTDRMVAPPQLVDRGDVVKIIAGDAGIQISVMGTALSDGKEGQQINVKNNVSGRTVRGIVVAQGLVQMP